MTDFKYSADVDYIYFLYDPDEGMLFFKCIKERHDRARSLISGYLDDDGWREEVTGIVTGTVTHLVQQTNVAQRPPDEDLDEDMCDADGTYWGEFSFRCDYSLTNLERIKEGEADEDTLSY